METIIDIIMWAFLIGTIFILFCIVGESVATKLPGSAFTKWWRKHMIGIDNSEDKF